jgi:hypothetical protein
MSALGLSDWLGRCRIRQEGSLYEHNHCCLRSAYRALHDPAAPLESKAETTDHGVPITEDMPLLRIDHISTKGLLLGVWQTLYGGRVFDFKEMNRCFIQVV